MTQRLAATMEVSADDLAGLAAARAQQVRDYFVKVGFINPGRLFLTRPDDPSKLAHGARASLSLQ